MRRRPADEPIRAAPVETTIAREVTARLGVPVTVRCAWLAGMPQACTIVVDGTTLPIAIENAGSGWAWHVEARIVPTAPIVAYVDGVLAELGVAQTARCGPAVVRVRPGDRIACAVSGGGTVFVDIAPDGELAVEVALDPAVAAIRAESPRDLGSASRALGADGGPPQTE